jgi:hypothetical protein
MKKTLMIFQAVLAAAAFGQEIPYMHFDQPMNTKDGLAYPSVYAGEGAQATLSLDSTDAISGKSLRITQTGGVLYLQFNPYGPGSARGFTHDYIPSWSFNTYDHLEFWFKDPPNGTMPSTNGSDDFQIGTYVKKVANPDPSSDEAGGNHYYHLLVLPPLGHWTKVVLNWHPSHVRGGDPNVDLGPLPHPTGESAYDYFDALTRWYINEPYGDQTRYPKIFKIDEAKFYKGQVGETDSIYSLTATYVPSQHWTLITASAWKKPNFPIHEFRYSKSPITSWAAATPCPNGRIQPPGSSGYNIMTYQTKDLNFQIGETVYFAVKADGQSKWANITLPIVDSLGRGYVAPPPPPTDTTGLCRPDTVHDTIYIRRR